MLPLRPMFSTMSVGTLDIEIIKARNLIGSDYSLFHENTSDPYCTIEINNLLIKSKIIHENNHPVWNQCWRISLNQLYDIIRIRVYDDDINVMNVMNDVTKTIGLSSSKHESTESGSATAAAAAAANTTTNGAVNTCVSSTDDFLGGVSIPLLALEENDYVEGWFPLTKNEDALLNGTPEEPMIEKSSETSSETTATTSSTPPTKYGEIYVRAKITTNTLSKVISSLVPTSVPIDYSTPTKFNVDLLYKYLMLNLEYLIYPLWNVYYVMLDIMMWKSMAYSSFTFTVLIFLSIYNDYIIIYIHIKLILYMWNVKKEKDKRMIMVENSQKKKIDLLSEALLKQRSNENGGSIIEKKKKVTTHSTKSKVITDGGGEGGVEEEEEEEEGFGLVVHSLFLLMPTYTKENLIWSQDLLKSSSIGLIYLYNLFHWGGESNEKTNDTMTMYIFVTLCASLFVFSIGYGNMNTILLLLGLFYLLSGTVLYSIVVTALVGIVKTIMNIISPPKIKLWLKRNIRESIDQTFKKRKNKVS